MGQNYKGKYAYSGAIASKYESDRLAEPLWAAEQEYVKQWVSTLPPNTSVIDVPVGTGRFLAMYAERRLRVLGVDVSSDMIAEARGKASECRSDCELLVGDAEALGLPDKSFDYVLCWRLAHLLPPPVLGKVLREFSRVSRNGVVVEVLSLHERGGSPIISRIKDRLRPVWHRLRRLRRGAQPWSHITNYAHTSDEIGELIWHAGLKMDSKRVIENGSSRPALVLHLSHA